MTYPTAEFLDALDERRHEVLLGKVRGTARIEVERGAETDQWLLSIEHGDIRISRGGGDADLVIGADQKCFDQLVRGEINLLSGWLRNDIAVSGRFELLVLLERLLPAPATARDPRDLVADGRRRS